MIERYPTHPGKWLKEKFFLNEVFRVERDEGPNPLRYESQQWCDDANQGDPLQEFDELYVLACNGDNKS